MTTDDRDPESANPSKSFKVGEFDRLSGFFTPVWESKRRLRSESPIPSSTAASAPSSARGPSSDKAATSRPSVPPPAPSRRSTPPPAKAGAAASSRPPSERFAAHVAADDVAAPQAVAGGDELEADPIEPEAEAVPDARVAALEAAAAVTVRPVIPMPKTPGRAPRSRPPSTPPPAPADEPLGRPASAQSPEALVEREPDFRSPPPAAFHHAAQAPRPPVQAALQRSARAAAAATAAMHDRFIKGRLQTDSVDTFARHRETESEREAAIAAAARAAATPEDPYSSHGLRSLRRTIHLSTPLPDAVRQMIEKYRY